MIPLLGAAPTNKSSKGLEQLPTEKPLLFQTLSFDLLKGSILGMVGSEEQGHGVCTRSVVADLAVDKQKTRLKGDTLLLQFAFCRRPHLYTTARLQGQVAKTDGGVMQIMPTLNLVPLYFPTL